MHSLFHKVSLNTIVKVCLSPREGKAEFLDFLVSLSDRHGNRENWAFLAVCRRIWDIELPKEVNSGKKLKSRGSPEVSSKIFERIVFSAPLSTLGFCYTLFKAMSFAGPISMFLPLHLHCAGNPTSPSGLWIDLGAGEPESLRFPVFISLCRIQEKWFHLCSALTRNTHQFNHC